MSDQPTRSRLTKDTVEILRKLGVPRNQFAGGSLLARTPISGEVIAEVRETAPKEAAEAIARAHAAFTVWRNVPPPRRGQLIRLLGEELRAAKDELGRLVTIETGKI